MHRNDCGVLHMATGRFPEFRERFCSLRGEMTQKEFAEKLEISRPTVALYESGERIPDALALKNIAEKCNVSSDWLLGFDVPSMRSPDVQSACLFTGLSEQAVLRLHRIANASGFSEYVNHFFSDFISEYVLEFSRHLHIFSKLANECRILGNVPCEDEKTTDRLKDFDSRYELACFRFSKLCSGIPEHLFGVDALSKRLNQELMQYRCSEVESAVFAKSNGELEVSINGND